VRPADIVVGMVLALLVLTGTAEAAERLVGVPRIIDGDTVAVNGITVRLNGIDAEEMGEPHGAAARAALQAAVGIGSPISCVLDGSRTHGREVGVCRNARGDDIAAVVIAQGLALDCAHYSRGRYRRLEPGGARRVLIQKPYC
jgi:micrococcal nuclease